VDLDMPLTTVASRETVVQRGLIEYPVGRHAESFIDCLGLRAADFD
jgi:hypothetical protein